MLERDALPVAAAHRKGVPQSRHAHALLAGGGVALEELFPGLADELVARGALSGDLQAEARFYNHGLYRATRDPAGDGVRLGAALRPLARPTLIIWGRHDPYLPVALAGRPPRPSRRRCPFPSTRRRSTAMRRQPIVNDGSRHLAGDDARERLLAGVPLTQWRLRLAGVATAVLEGGDGPPLVLLHGEGGWAAGWLPIIPDLVQAHRVVVPDLPTWAPRRRPRDHPTPPPCWPGSVS